MENAFDVKLTGSDTVVEGVARAIGYPGYSQAYEFNAIDESIHLIVGRNAHGHWERIAGTTPYFSSWVEELVEQVSVLK